MAGRKRKGTLVNYGGTWKARIANGPLIDLETTDRTLAERKLANLTGRDAGILDPVAETFQHASIRIVDALAAEGMLTARDRLARLRRYAWPVIGDTPVGKVTPRQITAILRAAADAGLAKDTVDHLRTDLSKVFGEMIRDEVLSTNPASAERIRAPKIAKDGRKRVLLTDAEFAQFVAHHLSGAPQAPRAKYTRVSPQKVTRHQLALMALVTRCFGGMRPSDLHAWQYTDIDLLGWRWADVPRVKTEHLAETVGALVTVRERLEMPDVLAVPLSDWHRAAGSPTIGRVFPLHQHSYARPLRRALLEAGITRHELHHDTDRTRATDFYSFRRAWASALAGTGINIQTAKKLTGHMRDDTHMLYDVRPVLPIPAAALPRLLQTPLPDDDWERALEAYQPPKWKMPAWPAAVAPITRRPEFYGTTIQAVDLITLLSTNYRRPQRDLNSCYRRERPDNGPDQNSSECQEETELFWYDAELGTVRFREQ